MKFLKATILIAIFSFAVFGQSNVSKPLVVKTAYVEPTNTKSFSATAYSLKGKMANGQTVHSGAVAADPRVLPLGTVIYIEGMGTYTVKDIGGGIKGNKLDIWMPSTASCLKFGRRTVKVRIISKPKSKLKT